MRCAHSLKGASRMMGFKTIESLSHYLESLLTQLIRGEKEVTPAIMDALYRDVDAVSHAFSALEEGKEPEGIDGVLEQMQIAVGEKSPSEAAPADNPKDARQEPRPSPGAAQASIRREEGSALTTIRVQTGRLDTLINQTGELLVAKIEALDNLRDIETTLELLEEWRKKLAQDAAQSPLLSRMDELTEELYNILQGLSESTHRLERLVDDIHEGVRDLRLLPLSTILDPFPRMVRDLSRDLGKEVELILQGASTRLDKKILEELRDPLIHLVRNSIDHGIESPEEREEKGKSRQGKIIIAARQEGGKVLISVTDDGRGLNRQAIEKAAVERGIASAEEIGRWKEKEVWDLVFRSGFSTSLTVTQVSGRGVGLDAVLNKIEGLKGSITTESKPGEGITFNLSLPLTLSTTHALLFQVGGDIYCLPTDALEKTLLLSPDQICSIEGKSTVIINGVPLAFAWLTDILNLPREETKDGTIPALLLQSLRGRAVLGVEAFFGEEEIVAKGLGSLLSHIPNLSGGTILGKGQIAFILNPNDLLRSLSHQGEVRVASSTSPASSPTLPLAAKKVLVVEDSLTTRTLEKNILESAGFNVTTAVDGEDGLLKLFEKRFDIVISDIQMPRLDGFALTERIKKDDRFKDIPLILVTALETEADKKRGIEAGADAYIAKSTFDREHLLEIIQRFI
ncbi:MAG: hybrid sensor histidine kinase/response regulator, partial [Deltaproteobacteria bacterium]|nr:hybrid sensor histidine kinase/response regulator [Deltaproteobacteria bacterium]